MSLVKIENHVEQALARLLSQYRGRPRLAALITSWARRAQVIENAAFDVLVSKLIDSATNAQLAFIGRLVGQVNASGWSDTVYRLYIKARIRVNQSSGFADDVIDVLRLVEPAVFGLEEYYPAAMLVDYATIPAASPAILIDLARGAKASGVRLQILYGDHNVGVDGFSFVSGSTDTASTTEGFGLPDESTGGYTAGVIE